MISSDDGLTSGDDIACSGDNIMTSCMHIASGAVVAHKNKFHTCDSIATSVGAFYIRVVGTVPAMTPVPSVKHTCMFRLVAILSSVFSALVKRNLFLHINYNSYLQSLNPT